MQYTKPHLLIGHAIENVKGTWKPGFFRENSIPHPLNGTVAAYEADE